eukprot:CAMPEP_0185044812 /NCGR_PEP_ID=MMETSP1103-20130426/43641_1 /TAXON_ID=36769 /ORGANISM="Paraphysomonas bandaiensis, Strain Caron Lab Isolate" /LENGTH=950 /DNA_ID=CAMNT_0027585087 /DNA_START=204 /DNA_END=3056 /DNA_ORIENTATION=+
MSYPSIEDDTWDQELNVESDKTILSADISSLALNLTSQTEYNNELLEYIRDLEKKCHQSEQVREKLVEKNESLHSAFREANSRADDLHNKLTVSSRLCDELSAQFHSVRDEAVQLRLELDSAKQTCESLKQQHAYLEENNKSLNRKNLELESEVDELRRLKKMFTSDETSDTIMTLTCKLESVEKELEWTRKSSYDVQTQASVIKDENIQLMRRIDHLLKQRDDDVEAKEKSQARYREATQSLTALQKQVADLTTRNDQLQESLTMSSLQLRTNQAAREEAVEHSRETDLRWRELEELAKRLEQERSDLQSSCDRLEEKNELLEERLRGLQERDSEWEQAVRDDCERSVQAMRQKMEDMSRELERGKRSFEDETEHHDAALLAATRQIEELNGMLSQCRKDLAASAEENKRVKQEKEARCTQLEEIVRELRDEKRSVVMEEREEINAAKRECRRLKDALIARGERYTLTLSAMHNALHAIGEEAAHLRSQFVYIAGQLGKLLVVMQQLSRSHELRADGATHVGDGMVPAESSPTAAYGREIHRTLQVLIKKVMESQEEVNNVSLKLKESNKLKHEDTHVIERLESQLVIAQEKIVFSKATISRLEKQCADYIQANKDVMQTMQQEREKAATRIDKAEGRVSEMIRQNTSIQTELGRCQADLLAVQTESESRASSLMNKLKKAEEERDYYAEGMKNSEAKYSALQGQLMQSEAKIAKQQSDFQKLKRISVSMRDDMAKFSAKHDDQVGSLHRALEQYRKQLDQKQQLIATLQAQRTELMRSSGGREESSSSSIGNIRGSHAMMGKDLLFNSRSAFSGTSNPHSSTAALSGLARLIHSHGDEMNGAKREEMYGNLSKVKSSGSDRDIGLGAFNSGLRHLTESVNQMHSEMPFRPPALSPKVEKGGRERCSSPSRQLSFDDMAPDIGAEDDNGSGIFRLTSPCSKSKYQNPVE